MINLQVNSLLDCCLTRNKTPTNQLNTHVLQSPRQKLSINKKYYVTYFQNILDLSCKISYICLLNIYQEKIPNDKFHLILDGSFSHLTLLYQGNPFFIHN
jgi:hypothetical protein